jgi:hypothetical protein
MTELPDVFDGANFVPLPESVILTLGNDAAAAYVILANAAQGMADADEALTAAQARVTECVAKVGAAEKYLADNYAKPTFHELWKENFGRR